MAATHRTILVVLGLSRIAGADPYFNSSEPGCDGSDSTVLLCDDFEDGDWFFDGDATLPTNDGWNRMSLDGASPAGAARCGTAGAAGTSCAALRTLHAGTHSTTGIGQGTNFLSVSSTATLPSAGSAMLADKDGCTEVTPGNCKLWSWTSKTAKTLYGFDFVDRYYAPHAVVGFAGGTNTADHALATGEDEVFVRYYYKADPGYVFGIERSLTFNDGATGDGGSKWGTVAFNCGDAPTLTGNLRIEYAGGCEDLGANILPGRWYGIEIHIKLDDVGADNGVLEVWFDDCGGDGLGCTAAPATLKLKRTDVNWGRTADTEKIRVLWWEDTANPPSAGSSSIDQIKVAKVGPITFGGPTSIGGDVTPMESATGCGCRSSGGSGCTLLVVAALPLRRRRRR